MPELPEVETIRRQLVPLVEGRTLTRIEILDPRWSRPLAPEARIVMLSAYDDPTLQSEAAEAGASRFLIKGCALSELVDAIAG